MTIFNQYSAAWIAVFVLLAAGVILLRRRPKWPQIAAFSLLVIGLVGAWIFLHPRQSGPVLDIAQVQKTIGQGKPVLLEFQSPY
jgi:drug/metabolite transporter (DMT)-like permease